MVYMDNMGRIVEHWRDRNGKEKVVVLKDKMYPCAKKVRFATEKDALFSLEKIAKVSTRKVIPKRVYHCECGGWHLTSKSDRFEEQVTPFKQEIERLNKELSESKETIEGLLKKNGREENVSVKSDKRVVELQKSVKTHNETIKKLRKDVSDLVSRLNDRDKEYGLDKLSVEELKELQASVLGGFKKPSSGIDLFKIYQNVFYYVRANKKALVLILKLRGDLSEREFIDKLILHEISLRNKI